MPKPNCYECKHRGMVAGSCHSCCKHPKIPQSDNEPLLEVLSIFASVGRAPSIGKVCEELKIKGNRHGIKHGWFNWPFNFDPVWLDNCEGFEQKEA